MSVLVKIFNRNWIRIAMSLSLLLLPASNLWAQDLSIMTGAMRSDSPDALSYAWSVSYMQNITDHLSATVSYLNEGHVPDHHRDGHTTQLWGRWTMADPQLILGFGVGPYRYFDTTVAENGGDYSDSHGWGAVFSGAATWYATNSWLYELRLVRVITSHSIDTTELMFGVGYRMRQDSKTNGSNSVGDDFKRHEISVQLGKTVVNSFSSEESRAGAIEYRYAFNHTIRVTAALVNEGDAELIRRNGAILQAWLEPTFFENRFTVGVGGGAYIAIDEYHSDPNVRHVSGMFTMTTSYNFAQAWTARFNWHRVVTDYDRDTDIILLGVGYRW